MDSVYLALVALAALAIGAWAMNIWGGWAEKAYERQKDANLSWYWLRLLGITTSRENCVRFIKVVSAMGIALLLVGLVAGLLFGTVR